MAPVAGHGAWAISFAWGWAGDEVGPEAWQGQDKDQPLRDEGRRKPGTL